MQSSFELHDEEEEVTMSPAKMPRKTWLPPEQNTKVSDCSLFTVNSKQRDYYNCTVQQLAHGKKENKGKKIHRQFEHNVKVSLRERLSGRRRSDIAFTQSWKVRWTSHVLWMSVVSRSSVKSKRWKRVSSSVGSKPFLNSELYNIRA